MPDFFKTRRHFLRNAVLGASATWTVPAFLDRTFAQLNEPERQGIATDNGKEGPILILLQLAGGNDGLNTLIPYNDDAYHRARPRLAKKRKDLLTINDYLAINSALPSLRDLYGNGELAILQGVGYPNPNRSHFVSTSIWETADPNTRSKTGWIGRYFDNQCQGADPSIGISLTGSHPEAFRANHNSGISLSTPDFYQWLHETKAQQNTFKQLNKPSDNTTPQSEGGNLAFLQRVALDARLSSSHIRQLAARHHTHTHFPNTPIGRQLELIARMMAGKMPTRIYYASHGGFDTHDNQAGRHEQLLGQLDAALKAFTTELRHQGNYQRTLLLTFSEFGRRVAENASGGTDHGKASCLFALGGSCKGGLYGTTPSLQKLDAGDLAHNTDFRQIYATVLEKWLHTKSAPILGGQYPPISFI